MKVSIITVVFDSVNTVRDALLSVADQDHDDIEHIVIDGASTDGSVAVIRQNSNRVAHFVSEPDQGIYDAMNKGLRLASGDIIGFLNSDDVYANRSVVSKIVSAFQRKGNEDLESVYADLIYLDNLGDTKIRRRWMSRNYVPGLCFKGWMPAHPTLYIRSKKFREIGLFNTSLGNQADLEFCARAFELHNMSSLYFSEIWVWMRTGGASQSSIRSMIKSNWRSYRALRHLGMKRDPISYFLIKFGSKLPQFFTKS